MIYKNNQTEVVFKYRDEHNMRREKTMWLDGILNAIQAEDILTNQYGFKIEEVREPSIHLKSWYTMKRMPIMHPFLLYLISSETITLVPFWYLITYI